MFKFIKDHEDISSGRQQVEAVFPEGSVFPVIKDKVQVVCVRIKAGSKYVFDVPKSKGRIMEIY